MKMRSKRGQSPSGSEVIPPRPCRRRSRRAVSVAQISNQLCSARRTLAAFWLSLPARHERGESRREGEIDKKLLLSPALSSILRRRGRENAVARSKQIFCRTQLIFNLPYRRFVIGRLGIVRKLVSHCQFLSLPICFLLLVAPALRAQNGTDADPLPMLVSLLRGTADPELQLDILRGSSAAFIGRRQVPMPKGWEMVESQ